MRAFVIIALLAAVPAYADDEVSEPKPTTIRGQLDGTTARLVARFAVPVPGPTYAPSVASLMYPAKGVVIGATVTAFGVSRRTRFLTNEASEAVFDKVLMGNEGEIKPHGWMIRLTGGAGTISLDIAVPRATTFSVELELALPTCFDRDVRYVALPKTWRGALDRTLSSVSEARETELVTRCDSSTDQEATWVAFPSNELAARPPGDSRIDGVAMRLPLGDRDLARVELDLSRVISVVPADLHTAIVIDNSRSLTRRELEVQRAIVASYLRHTPQTHVQVIAFAHTARALLPGWMPAARAAPRIDREIGALAARNGSDVDVGLAEAATWLGRATGTKRVLLFTDQRLAQHLIDEKPATLRAMLPADTIVHVVALQADQGPLERDDDLVLAGLAKAAEGIAVRGRLDDKDRVDTTMLVRPITLDRLTIHAPGWETLSLGDSQQCAISEQGSNVSLKEGEACTWIGEGTASSGPVVFEGFLWGRRFTRMLRPDPSQSRTLARLLSAIGGFEQPLQHHIDQLAYAVNTVWSLSAVWGQPGGYNELSDSIGVGRFGSSCGDGGVIDTGFGVGTLPAAARDVDLAKQFRDAIAGCGVRGARVELDLETTLEEIVGVEAQVDGLTTGALHDCVETAVWNTEAAFPHPLDHDTMHFLL